MAILTRLLMGVVTLALLSGCTTALAPEQTEAIGPPFNESLKDGYIRLASAQLNDFDPSRYGRFRDKARAAMIGDTVQPDRVADRRVGGQKRSDALALRARLIRQLEGGARERNPDLAAEAQVSFDCWLSSAGDDAALCKDSLMASLDQLEATGPAAATTFQIRFPSGRTSLDEPAQREIELVAGEAAAVGARRVEIVGYADRSGTPEANLDLSLRRAQAVSRALVREGVDIDLLDVSAGGETGGTDDASSRRVDIVVVP